MTQFVEPIHVLIVEDNPGDVDLLLEGLESSRVNNTITAVGSGERAIAYLRHQREFEDADRPDLIFLDLNLPGTGGLEVLREIRGDEGLTDIPVVVLTRSEAAADITAAYDLGANAHVTKPLGYDEFIEAIRSIETFWLSVVRLPRA
jgi:CheY-like chemotaxis protein